MPAPLLAAALPAAISAVGSVASNVGNRKFARENREWERRIILILKIPKI